MPCESHGNCMNLARPKRFELLTPRFVVWCSIQLSYGRVWIAENRRLRGRPAKRAIAIDLDLYWQAGRAKRARDKVTAAAYVCCKLRPGPARTKQGKQNQPC